MKKQNKSLIFFITLIYIAVWAGGLGLIILESVKPLNSTQTSSSIPELNTSVLQKAKNELSKRQPAELSGSFDFNSIQFGKEEPFR